MKFMPTFLVSFFLAACRGPEVPPVFSPESPASPTASPAPRQSVADVLSAQDPLDARGGAPATVAPPAASTTGHEHHHGHHHH